MLLTFSIYLVGTLLVITCLLIVLLVLMQRPKQEGLGAAFGAGVTDQIWGSQTTNVLQKGTVYLGVMFFALSITLCILEARKSKELTGMKVPTTPVVVTPDSPATPASTGSTPFQIPSAPASTPVPAAPGETTPPAGTPAPAAAPAETAPADATPPPAPTAPAEAPAAVPAAVETPAPAVEVPATPAK